MPIRSVMASGSIAPAEREPTPLTNYAEDVARCIVVASRGGAPTPPAWLLNLEANPEVEVQITRRGIQRTPTVLGRADPEFARLWRLGNDRNSNRYDAYQRKTDREIPMVALSPKI